MRWSALDGVPPQATLEAAIAKCPLKFHWFIQHGYSPHVFQILFHGMTNPEGNLTRYRHLVAGRRGGKTLSAAWEVLYYCLHPEAWYEDAHGQTWNGRPLWVWALAKDYKVGRPSYLTFLQVIRQAGLVPGTDYKLHKGERYIEFYRNDEPIALLEFKTADDPESLRGAGLDLLWMDEAAFIRNGTAWDVVSPSLSDRQGGVLTTTTPAGKNWLHEWAFGPIARADVRHGSVEYRSVDNPHFSAEEWKYQQRTMHPMLFAQEYLASFDAFMGVELPGDWLHYYSVGQASAQGDDIVLPRVKDGKLPLRTYIGVDPAISLSDTADRFAMSLVGVDGNTGNVFLLDLFAGRIPFPEQVKLIQTWWLKYRPQVIAIESNAYQAALAQATAQIEGLPPVQAVPSKGKKSDRILRMSPLFQMGKVRIHRTHTDFIDEWISFDSQLKNGKDDVLDSVAIALTAAGALFPEAQQPGQLWTADLDRKAANIEELAARELSQLKAGSWSSVDAPYDDEMGGDW